MKKNKSRTLSFNRLFPMTVAVVLSCAMIGVGPVWAQTTNDTMEMSDDGTKTLGVIIDELATIPSGEPVQDIVNDPNANIIDPDFLLDDVKAYDDYPTVTVRILDKITANTKTYDLDIGKTVAFGDLRIRPTTCKKAPPIEEPESASFLQIWEKTHEGSDEWVFSGWMFASSPSLSPMNHPVYDVWVIDCKE